MRSVSRGVALVLLALLPAYCSIEGLVTGETLVIARRTHSYDGDAGVITAIAYALFAAALVIGSTGFFSADPKRQKTLFKWGWKVAIAGAVCYFAGRLAWALQ